MSLRERKPASSLGSEAQTAVHHAKAPQQPKVKPAGALWIGFSVILSYVAVSVITFVFFISVHIAMRGNLNKENIPVWMNFAIIVLAIGSAAVGGILSVTLSRTRKAPRLLGGMMALLGIANMWLNRGMGEPLWFQVALILIPYPVIMWSQKHFRANDD